jgi:hypothetical protein
MAVYQVVATIEDEEAWIDGPELVVAGDRQPPPPSTTAPAVTGDGDPVDLVRATFGPEVTVMFDTAELRRLVGKLIDAQRRRDPAALDKAGWQRLIVAADSGDDGEVVAAARALVDWCAEKDPGRLGLGGWKLLVGQLDMAEGRYPEPEARLVPHPENVRHPKP